jgi:cysteinyl-tRNA synthetase
LQYCGYEVTWVVNITDVDDKLIVRSKELGTTVKELAEKMTADYVECLKKLGVTGIDRMPKATEHIAEMIAIMRDLIAKGFAYAAGGDVYFDVSKDEDYGKLCNRDPEQLEAGSRIEVSDRKRNPGDFALWKGAKPGEPAWDSPWGPGRPGWHIECSAMSMKYLGATLDIHGGGLDLQFPHHENELAQSESHTGKTFARYWMHNGLLKMGKSKMAGSVGNVVNVVDLLAQHSPETVRLLLLGTHYRSPIEYSEERFAELRKSLESFQRFFERYQRVSGASFFDLEAPRKRGAFDANGANREFLTEVARLREIFLEHMDDDFNTGGAVGVLFELLTALNRFVDERGLEGTVKDPAALTSLKAASVAFRELTLLLGIFVTGTSPAPTTSGLGLQASLRQLGRDLGMNDGQVDELTRSEDVGPMIQQMIEMRLAARKNKNFALADQIRKRLGDIGVTLEDRPGGTGWRVG